MKKTDVSFPAFAVSPASTSDLQPVRRLIVLVPESELDLATVARRIRELAGAFENRVLLLGLSSDTTNEPGLRRQLVALSAMVMDKRIFVETKTEVGIHWLSTVKSEWQPGDAIACFSASYPGFARKPLHQILESNLNSTVYVLAGSHQRERYSASWRVSDAAAWIGSIGLILGFLWLQIKIVQFPQDWAHALLLYLSLFVEIGAIWMWNRLAG